VAAQSPRRCNCKTARRTSDCDYTFLLGTFPIQTFSNLLTSSSTTTQQPHHILQTSLFSGVSSYSRITVTLTALSHTFPDDIDIILVAPGGQKAYVMSDVGGGTTSSASTSRSTNNAATAFGAGEITWAPISRATGYGSDILPDPAPSGPYSTNSRSSIVWEPLRTAHGRSCPR